MAFAKGTFQPEEVEKLSSALHQICAARSIASDSLERAWIAEQLMNAIQDPDAFDEAVKQLSRSAKAA